MDLFSYLLLSFVQWGKHTIGVAKHPYITYRALVQKGVFGELLFILFFIIVYIAVASLIRIPEFRLHLLTKEFIKLLLGAVAGYGLSVGTLYILGKLLRGEGTLKSVCLCWGYSLVATICWFFITSFLFVLFPPPRTETMRGISFSFLYLVFSSVLFFWKAELYYFTLRFSMKLNLQKIVVASFFFFPIMAAYAMLMYRIGIYRIPFL